MKWAVKVRFIIALTLSLCLSLPIVTPLFSDTFGTLAKIELCVLEVKQEKSCWCWAATMQSITDWHDDNYDQYDIYEIVKGDTEYRDEPASWEEVWTGYKSMGYGTTYVSGVMDWDEMADEIWASRPIHVAWDRGMGVHASVLCGWATPPDEPEDGYYIMDPDPALGYRMFREKSWFDQWWGQPGCGSVKVYP